MTFQKEITLLPPARAEDYDDIEYLNQLFFGPDGMIARPGHAQMLEDITPFIPPANGQDPIDYLGTVKFSGKDGQLNWSHINNSSDDEDYSDSNMANCYSPNARTSRQTCRSAERENVHAQTPKSEAPHRSARRFPGRAEGCAEVYIQGPFT
jgi:hypothetical protein